MVGSAQAGPTRPDRGGGEVVDKGLSAAPADLLGEAEDRNWPDAPPDGRLDHAVSASSRWLQQRRRGGRVNDRACEGAYQEAKARGVEADHFVELDPEGEFIRSG